jgi:hypothetical protein
MLRFRGTQVSGTPTGSINNVIELDVIAVVGAVQWVSFPYDFWKTSRGRSEDKGIRGYSGVQRCGECTCIGVQFSPRQRIVGRL